MSEPDYTEADIETLSAQEHIRRRPKVYFQDDVLNNMLLESLCLSLAEAHCGTCTEIRISASGRSASIADNGLGLSLEKRGDGTTFAESLFTRIHTCRDHKAHQELGHELCRVGVVPVVALCDVFSATIHKDGRSHQQVYRSGVPEAPFRDIGETTRSGTTLEFTVGEEFAATDHFDLDLLRSKIAEKDINLSNTAITITD
jgi:DNA gyrase subunit B